MPATKVERFLPENDVGVYLWTHTHDWDLHPSYQAYSERWDIYNPTWRCRICGDVISDYGLKLDLTKNDDGMLVITGVSPMDYSGVDS